eukprot:gene5478-10935_t
MVFGNKVLTLTANQPVEESLREGESNRNRVTDKRLQLVGGADWSNCGRSDDVVMHFPDPHGKGFPTKYSLTDWGGDFTDSIGGRLDLNGMVFSGKKEYLDGLVGSSTVQLWNGYPQYYSTKKVPGTNAWFALRRSQNGHLLLQRTDRHTNEGDAKSYVGIQLFPAALPLGTSGKTWKFSPGNTDLDGLPSSQFDVTIRLDCCKTTYGSLGGDGEMGYSRTIKKVTWSTPGIWSDARGLGSKCGKAANGFPNGVRKRSVKCGGQSDCQTCAYTDETDTKPATLEAYTYACGTVATTKTTATIPCTNVPYTITVKTKIDCTAQGTRYKVTLAECRAKQPCQCDGNNPQGSIILDETDPCCNWQGDRGATLPGTHCGEQPQTWVTYWCPCAKCIGNQPSSQLHPASKSAAAVAVPVVLLLLAASVAGIAFVIRRIQNGNLPLPAQGNNANVVTNQTFDNTATPMARTGSVVVLGNNRQRYLVPMEPERVRPAPSADGGSDSDYVPPSAAQARAYDMNPLLGAYDRSVQLAVYEEVDEDAGSSTTAAPPTAQLGADGYMDDSSVNQPQEIEYATAAPPTAQLGADGYMDDSSVNQPQEIEYATAAPPTAQLGADGYMDDSSVNQPQEIEYATAVQTTLSDTADYSVSAPLPSTAVYSPPVGSTEVVLAAYSSHV